MLILLQINKKIIEKDENLEKKTNICQRLTKILT